MPKEIPIVTRQDFSEGAVAVSNSWWVSADIVGSCTEDNLHGRLSKGSLYS